MSQRRVSNEADKRLFFVSLTIFVGVCALVIVSASGGLPGGTAGRFSASPTPAQAMTLAPQVFANLTAIPQMAELSGDLRTDTDRVAALLADCADYSDERRGQMQQHIAWLRAPATLPRDIILALGDNPTGRLIFGMATYTSIEWRLRDRPADSCLLAIGRLLNTMLAATGETPFEEFEL